MQNEDVEVHEQIGMIFVVLKDLSETPNLPLESLAIEESDHMSASLDQASDCELSGSIVQKYMDDYERLKQASQS